MTAALPASFLTTLAVATAGEVGKSSFGGESVTATDVLVMYTYNGDANLSGNVDADDYFQIDSHYGKSGAGNLGFFNGDFDYDGDIDGDDFMLIDMGFSGQTAPFMMQVASVPEPGVTPILCIGMLLVDRARRRR
jgi:hypothetical protein